MRSRVMAPQDRHRTAIHEAGHAVVAWFSTNANPPVKASIVWRGETLGFVQVRSGVCAALPALPESPRRGPLPSRAVVPPAAFRLDP